MPELLLAKLLPPRLKRDFLDRPRLLGLFAGWDERKMTLLAAPAGYGKTVLMLQAAQAAGRPFAWYQLDAYDNDSATFLRYLAAGIERHIPGFGKQLQQAMGGGVENRLRLLVTAFVNELSQHAHTPLLLVLDDYHEITAPFVHAFLQDVQAHLPGHVHIMAASRTLPPLRLGQLKASGEAAVIGAGELRFTGEELRAFLAERRSRLSGEAVAMLERKVEGWPAAVKFLAGLDLVDASSFNPDGGAAEAYEYLAAEVLARQPADVVEFLEKSAILETITAEDCDQLLARDDSRRMLALLEKQNLFLIPLAGPGKSYRYHQLFREFLLERLGAERPRWQREAGILARKRGDLSAAVEYFRVAGAGRDLLAVLKEAVRQAFGQGRWQTVARWLGAVAEEELAADPWLALYRARSEIYQGRLEEADEWLQGAGSLFASGGDESGLAECRLSQAHILRCRGLFTESLELLERLPEAESAPNFDIPLEKSSCLFFAGRLAEAEAVMVGALAAAKRSNDKYAMAHLMEGLGHVYFALGDYPKALQMYKKGAEPLPDWFLPSYHMQDYIAFIYLDWGEWEQALDYAKRNLAVKENLGLTDALPSTYIQLASIYLSRGEWQLAEEYCNQAIGCVRENGGGIYSAIALSAKAECLGVQGRWIEAQESAEEALAEARLYQGAVETLCQLLGGISFIYTGALQRGQELLAAAIDKFERSGFIRGLYYGYAFQAWLYINEGKLAEARKYTEKVLKLAAKHNLLNVLLTHEMLRSVLKLGMENGIEVAFVQRVFTRMGERAFELLVCLAGHASPEVRCRTIAPLAEIGGSEAGETIRRLTKDPDAEVSRLARLAAQRLGIIEFARTDVKAPAAPLAIATFGSFKVFRQGMEVGGTGWRTIKTRDLLAYLVHHGEPVSKDKILEDLWPDTDPDRATVIFRTTLYNLRKALEKAECPDITHYSARQYRLQPGSFSSDRQRFQELVAAGLRPDTAREEAVKLLEQAVSLYCGDYLGDMDYPWLLHHQESLRHLYSEARKCLARFYLEARDYSRAVSHLHIVEAYDPFAEEVHALLMTAYTRQGNRSAAKRQYKKLESVLQKELGLAPTTAIHNLYRELVE